MRQQDAKITWATVRLSLIAFKYMLIRSIENIFLGQKVLNNQIRESPTGCSMKHLFQQTHMTNAHFPPSKIRLSLTFLALSVLLIALSGCGSLERLRDDLSLHGEDALASILGHPHPEGEPIYSVFLAGDGGDPWITNDSLKPALEMLRAHLGDADSLSAVVFLGDNIYPSGLPNVGENEREEAEEILQGQIVVVEDFPGRIIFLPGNHDWGGGGMSNNRERVLNQERFIEDALQRGNTFLPDGASPGPVAINLSDALTLIVLDTQRWLQRFNGGTDDALAGFTELAALDSMILANAGRDILVVGHHPIFTNGPHGGFLKHRQGIGGLQNLARRQLMRTALGRQDVTSPGYRRMGQTLLESFEQHEGLIYAAGHEHSLQYFRQSRQHYVVSGSLAKLSFVEEGNGATYTHGNYGFGVVRYYRDGSVWLEFWEPDELDAMGNRIFHARIEPDIYIAEAVE